MTVSKKVQSNAMLWILRALPLLMAAYVVYLIVMIATKPKVVFSVDPEASETDRTYRQQFRGVLTSIVASLLGLGAMAGMMSLGVPMDLIETNLSFLFMNVIGYQLDYSFATDNGLRRFAEGRVGEGFGAAFSGLYDLSFIRFFLTVLLDMFISLPILEVLTTYSARFLPTLAGGGAYDRLLGHYLRPLMLSITLAVTFLAYSNMTRFQWAYPSENPDDKERISDSSFFVALAVSIGVFAVFYMVLIDAGTNYSGNVALGAFYILLCLILMAGLLSLMRRPAKTPEEAAKEAKSAPTWLHIGMGIAIFVVAMMIGVAVPLWSRRRR